MSDLFRRIRVKPDEEEMLRRSLPRCDRAGCENAGTHRAPKGREREGQYWCFCLDHVREYNQSYNYFAGMSDTDMETYIRSASFGHRPTWSMGVNSWGRRERRAGATGTRFDSFRFDDPHGLFDDAAPGFDARPREESRPVRNVERRSFGVLNLEPSATAAEIKARYKELVKRHHPDANGGDRACEDKLREVIEAYGHLKAAGFCD